MDNQIDTPADLAHFDDDNESYGYQSETFSDGENADETLQEQVVARRGLTRLSKFRKKYGKPDSVKLKLTFDSLNRIFGPNRAVFSSFLGDLVRENIGLKILTWKKVNQESRDKLWDEITRFFEVDVTAKKLVMIRSGKLLRNFRRKLRERYIMPNQDTPLKLNELPAQYNAILTTEEWVSFVAHTTSKEYQAKSAATKMARSKSAYQHTMGRGGYALVKEKMIENKEIEEDEEPLRSTLWLHGRLKKDGEPLDDEVQQVGVKLKEADDKIRDGTLTVDDGSDAMTVVFGKENGGYARGVGSGVTYKKYFHLPRNKQASDERIALLETQLDTARRERLEKDQIIKTLSSKQTQTENMMANLVSQLAARGVHLDSLSTQMPSSSSDVTPVTPAIPVGINTIANIAVETGGTKLSVDRSEKETSIKKSKLLATSEKQVDKMVHVKTVGCKTGSKTKRKASPRQNLNAQGDVSPPQTQVIPVPCKLWHLNKRTFIALGTVYKSDCKQQMLHNQVLPNDCFKVSVDTPLVDAAFIPDVANNGCKTIADSVGSFIAWPKNQVVFPEEEITPPNTKQVNAEIKGVPKRKGVYISSDAFVKQVRNSRTQKSLNYA